MSKLTKPVTRVAKWDNTKFFLIICVVLGHSMSSGLIDNGPLMKTVELFLYSFHMPLFIFIGGLFAKKTVDSVPFQYEKVVSYLLLSFFMKILNYLSKLIITGKATFELLSDNAVSWYIFATAVHIMIAHLLRNCNPRKILAVSFIIAVLIGYVDEIGNTFVLSRIIVFFPIFYLGYMLKPNEVLSFTGKSWVRICSVIIIIAILGGFYLTIDKAYFLRRLFTGNNPYYEFKGILHLLGGGIRIFCYLISILVSIAVLSLIPNKRMPVLTWAGSRTLSVYALHRAVQYIIGYGFFDQMFKDTLPRLLLPILLIYALILTLVLSLKPFDYIIWPCMNWNKLFAPLMNWFRKDESKTTK